MFDLFITNYPFSTINYLSPGSIGKPASFQACVPPMRAKAFLIPFFSSRDTRPALVCSFAQEQ